MLLGGVQESPFGNRQPVYTYVNRPPVASSRFLEDSATRQEAYSGCIDPKGLCPLTNPLQPAEGWAMRRHRASIDGEMGIPGDLCHRVNHAVVIDGSTATANA